MKKLFILLLGLLAFPAFAQSTATNAVTGYLSSSNHTCGQTTCFVQYGATGGPGGAVTQGTSPWVSSITTWATGTLGAMANYGTSPGAVLVPGVNAYVTAGAITDTPTANVSAAVTVSTATTTQIVAATSGTIHVSHWLLVTTLADNVTWESGDTGGSCANPVALTGAIPFGANSGASVGSGFGDVLVLPAGKALCVLTSAATQISGSVAYRQF